MLQEDSWTRELNHGCGSVSFQLLGHWGRSRELRAAGVCEGLLLRQRGPHRGHGRAAGEGHSQQGQRHLLDAAGQTHPHGRDGPDGAAHPLPAQQRRRGERVRQAQVGPALGRGGPQLRGDTVCDRHSIMHTYSTHTYIDRPPCAIHKHTHENALLYIYLHTLCNISIAMLSMQTLRNTFIKVMFNFETFPQRSPLSFRVSLTLAALVSRSLSLS